MRITMKQAIFISIAALALLAASCQKAEIPQQGDKQNQIVTVTADIASFETETKTSIDGAATAIRPVWSEGDEIKLFNTEGNSSVYVVNAGAGTSLATFSLKDGETALTGTFACAYYPADSARTYVQGVGITAGIPSTQIYTANGTGKNAGTFANGSFPMVGYGTLNAEDTNMNLTFKNLFGLVQINLKDASATVSRIDIVGASPLSGTASVTPQTSVEGAPTCTVSGNKYITLVASTPVALNSTTSTAFYIAVPTCTLSRVYLTTSSKLVMKNTSSVILRSKIKNMPEMTISSETAVTYSEYTAAKPVVVAGILWAPVNCGYEPADGDNKSYTYGKMYQWGRKYGHGYYSTTYEDNDYPGKSGGSQPIEYITKDSELLTSHPDTAFNGKFYSNSTSSGGGLTNDKIWYNGADPDKLWNKNEGTGNSVSKSDYDPCPEGWRVPTAAELTTLIGNKTNPDIKEGDHGESRVQGSTFDGDDGDSDNFVFLPYAGYLLTSGSGSNRGLKCYYWSSSVKDEKIQILLVGGRFTSKVMMGEEPKRTLGQSVRCVKE